MNECIWYNVQINIIADSILNNLNLLFLLFLLSLNIVNFNDNNFTTQSLDDRNWRLLKHTDALVTRYPCVAQYSHSDRMTEWWLCLSNHNIRAGTLRMSSSIPPIITCRKLSPVTWTHLSSDQWGLRLARARATLLCSRSHSVWMVARPGCSFTLQDYYCR